MDYEALDPVVVGRNLPLNGLRRGDLGTNVYVHGPEAMEVELVTASGRTQALVTLSSREVRPVQGDDPVSVRPVA